MKEIKYDKEKFMTLHSDIRGLLIEFARWIEMELSTEEYEQFWFEILFDGALIIFKLVYDADTEDEAILTWHIFITAGLNKLANAAGVDLSEDISPYENIGVIIESHDLWKDLK